MSTPLVVWVLARPGDPGLHLLEPPPEGIRFVVGWEPDAFDGAPSPDALLDCWAGPTRIVAALRRAPGLRWIHARSAGLDHVLVPEVVAHPARAHERPGRLQPRSRRVRPRRAPLLREGPAPPRRAAGRGRVGALRHGEARRPHRRDRRVRRHRPRRGLPAAAARGGDPRDAPPTGALGPGSPGEGDPPARTAPRVDGPLGRRGGHPPPHAGDPRPRRPRRDRGDEEDRRPRQRRPRAGGGRGGARRGPRARAASAARPSTSSRPSRSPRRARSGACPTCSSRPTAPTTCRAGWTRRCGSSSGSSSGSGEASRCRTSSTRTAATDRAHRRGARRGLYGRGGTIAAWPARPIVPCLWLDDQAEEAASFYAQDVPGRTRHRRLALPAVLRQPGRQAPRERHDGRVRGGGAALHRAERRSPVHPQPERLVLRPRRDRGGGDTPVRRRSPRAGRS